jgi:ethanolamine ammonia-lyase large subunit
MEKVRVSGDLCELLKEFIDDHVIIIFESGKSERVVIKRVIGNLVVGKLGNNHFIFINCDCICAVIASCEEILD